MKPKIKIHWFSLFAIWWCYLICFKRCIEGKDVLQEKFFLENSRNQSENLEKFKKQPCKAKKNLSSEKRKIQETVQYGKKNIVSYIPMLRVMKCCPGPSNGLVSEQLSIPLYKLPW